MNFTTPRKRCRPSRVRSVVRNMEYDDMKSERMIIKSAELFDRIMSEYDSLRALQRELKGVVSASTLSNWTKKRDPVKVWTADRANVEAVAKALGCDMRDIAYCPTPPTPSRYQLRMVLSGCPEQLMDLNVCGEELSLKAQAVQSDTFHGHVLSRGKDVLTAHLRVHQPILSLSAPEGALWAEEMAFLAQYSGDTIRGACLLRDRKGNIKQAVFEGVRKGVSL